MDSNEMEHIKSIVLSDMDKLRQSDHVDMLFFMITNIMKESSEVLFSGTKAEIVLESGFSVTSKNHKSVYLPGVVSRKKQMVPTITNTIEQLV